MSEFTIVLGNRNYSSWSLRAWLMLAQTGAEFSETVIPLDRADTRDQIRRYSPSGKVPVLLHGDRTIWESLAIGEYLAELFPDCGLWPAEQGARAHARAVAAEMHAGFAALRAHFPMNVRSSFTGRAASAEAQQDINRVAAIWRDCRSRFGGDGDYLFGDFCIADAMYAPVVTRFQTYGLATDETAAAYCSAVRDWPAMKKWAESAANEPWIVDYAEF